MLRNIEPVLSPRLLEALRAMSHAPTSVSTTPC